MSRKDDDAISGLLGQEEEPYRSNTSPPETSNYPSSAPAPGQSPDVPLWGATPSAASDSENLGFHTSNYSTDVGGRMGKPTTTAPPTRTTERISTTAPVAPGVNPNSDPNAPSPTPSIFSIERYKLLFNVDTSDVLDRLLASTAFFFRGDFLEKTEANPDLYGPFWVASTLVFVMAAVGNLISYFNFKAAQPDVTREGETIWYIDADKAVAAIALFYGYVFVVPLIFWVVFRYLKAPVSLVQTMCIFGYSLALFAPVGVLCAIPVSIAQWVFVGVAFGMSAFFLLHNFTANVTRAAENATEMFGGKVKENTAKTAVSGLVIVFHAGLALALKLYFFRFRAST